MGNRIDDKDKIRRITLSISSEIEVIPFAPVDFNLENPFCKRDHENGDKTDLVFLTSPTTHYSVLRVV